MCYSSICSTTRVRNEFIIILDGLISVCSACCGWAFLRFTMSPILLWMANQNMHTRNITKGRRYFSITVSYQWVLLPPSWFKFASKFTFFHWLCHWSRPIVCHFCLFDSIFHISHSDTMPLATDTNCYGDCHCSSAIFLINWSRSLFSNSPKYYGILLRSEDIPCWHELCRESGRLLSN